MDILLAVIGFIFLFLYDKYKDFRSDKKLKDLKDEDSNLKKDQETIRKEKEKLKREMEEVEALKKESKDFKDNEIKEFWRNRK